MKKNLEIFNDSKDNIIFLCTCMQNPRLRTVYRQRKWLLSAPVHQILALGRKSMALVNNSVLCNKCGTKEIPDECVTFAARAIAEYERTARVANFTRVGRVLPHVLYTILFAIVHGMYGLRRPRTNAEC